MPNNLPPLSPEELVNIDYSVLRPALSRTKILKMHEGYLKKLTLEEAFVYDKLMLEKTFDIPNNAPVSVQQSNKVLERLATILKNVEIELSSYQLPKDNIAEDLKTPPVDSLLTHGDRFIIAAPKGTGDQLYQAIIGEAEVEDRTSTHDIKYNPTTKEIKEINGKTIGLIHSLPGATGKNVGLNINVGGYGKKDIHGNQIGNELGATGANGHILFFLTSKGDKDFIMIGIEGSAPGKTGTFGFHGLGASNTLSAFGTIKMNKLGEVYDNENHILPGKNSIRVVLTPQKLGELLELFDPDTKQLKPDIHLPVALKGGVEHYIDKQQGLANEALEHGKSLEKYTPKDQDIPSLNKNSRSLRNSLKPRDSQQQSM